MYRCEAEIEAAREAGVKVIPCYSGDDYGATRSMLMRALCEPTALHPAHATYIGRGAWARTVGTFAWRLLERLWAYSSSTAALSQRTVYSWQAIFGDLNKYA